MEPSDIDDCARALFEAWRTRQWVELPERLRPDTLDDAYAVQIAGERISGRRRAGWKIGCTTERMQRALGVDEPFSGPLYADALFTSPAAVADCRADMQLIEGEFAFLLAGDLPPEGAPYGRAAVVAAVGAVVPAIEIVQERTRGGRPAALADRIADNAGHGYVVLGEPHTRDIIPELPGCPVRVVADGEELASGTGEAVLGDPVNALVWLANRLAGRGLGLRRGDVVMSGSCTGIVAIPAETAVTAEFGPLGSVEMTLKASPDGASEPITPERLAGVTIT